MKITDLTEDGRIVKGVNTTSINRPKQNVVAKNYHE